MIFNVANSPLLPYEDVLHIFTHKDSYDRWHLVYLDIFIMAIMQ